MMEEKINIEIDITGPQYEILKRIGYLNKQGLRDFFEGRVRFIDYQPLIFKPEEFITPEDLQLPIKEFKKEVHYDKNLLTLRMENVHPKMKDKVKEYLAQFGLELNF